MGWRRFWHRTYWARERARELESYLAHEIDDNLARGMTPENARRAAYRKLGNPTLIREEIYTMNSLALETVWQDVRYGLRLLRRNPTFAAVAVLTVALGTGANAAIFQLVDAIRIRTLPVREPQQLVSVTVDTHDKGRTGRFQGARPMMTNALWEAVAREQQAFTSMLAWGAVSFDLATGGESQPVRGMWVSGDFFETLGVPAHAGRVLTRADDRQGCGLPAAVLSYGFWRARFNGDPSAIGRPLLLDGHPFEIVGVTPPTFFGVEVGRSFDVAVPLCAEALVAGADSGLERLDFWFLDVMGRLKPGWSIERAQAHLAAISPPIFRATVPPGYTAEDATIYQAFTFETTRAGTGVSPLRRAYERPLWVLLGLTGLVLLIACANLANLMLARATAREREIAVRLAIGASRRRIVRQMFSESLLIAVFGAAGGLLLARWLSESLVAFLSTEGRPVFVDLTANWRMFVFIAGLAVAACLAFGLVPALRSTAVDPGRTIGGRGSTDSRERFGLRRGLVVVQVALSLVLLVGALLFGGSLRNLLTLDPGFREDGILIASFDLRRAGASPAGLTPLFDEIVERVRSIPAVQDTSEAYVVPVTGAGWNGRVLVHGVLQKGIVNRNRVGPGYFRTFGTRMLAGRDFDSTDTPGAPPAAIVNETFVQRYLGGRNPIGETVQFESGPGDSEPLYRIVGLVQDTKYRDLREPFEPIVYVASSQAAEQEPYLQLVVRSEAPLATVAAEISRAVTAVRPTITVQFQTLAVVIRDALVRERLMAILSGFFGGLAALIATVGLYGVMSYVVTRRRAELGIRMALGADRGRVVRMVVGDAGRLVAAGLVVGGVLAVILARSAGTLLFGLQPWDPATLVISMGALAGVALLASWIPAYRAARLEPREVLRTD